MHCSYGFVLTDAFVYLSELNRKTEVKKCSPYTLAKGGSFRVKHFPIYKELNTSNLKVYIL